jgi:hypothetical protein
MIGTFKRAGGGVEAVDALDHLARARSGTGAIRRVRQMALVQVDRHDRRVDNRQEFIEALRSGSPFAVHESVHGTLLGHLVGADLGLQPISDFARRARLPRVAAARRNVLQRGLRKFNNWNIFIKISAPTVPLQRSRRRASAKPALAFGGAKCWAGYSSLRAP